MLFRSLELEATTEAQGDLAATWQNVGAEREVMGDALGARKAYDVALRLEPTNEWLAAHVHAMRGKD